VETTSATVVVPTLSIVQTSENAQLRRFRCHQRWAHVPLSWLHIQSVRPCLPQTLGAGLARIFLPTAIIVSLNHQHHHSEFSMWRADPKSWQTSGSESY
jgi:catechol-2,3-dioxygenase